MTEMIFQFYLFTYQKVSTCFITSKICAWTWEDHRDALEGTLTLKELAM